MNTYNIRFADDNGRIKSVTFISSLTGQEIAAEAANNHTVTVTDHKTNTTHVIPTNRIISVEKI